MRILFRLSFLIFWGCLLHTAAAAQTVDFDTWFQPKALRFDFSIGGDAATQTVYAGRMREEPHWAGPRNGLISPFNFGEYACRIYDKASGKLLFTTGFSSLFLEWRTTAEAGITRREYPHSLSFPYPKAPVRFELLQRNRTTMAFEPLFSTEIEPSSKFIERGKLNDFAITRILYNGNPASHLDLVFVAEGYTESQQAQFIADANKFADYLFSVEPYSNLKSRFNIWAVGAISKESGTDNPGRNEWKNTALNSTFYTFDVERYLTTPSFTAIRDAVSETPVDAVYVIVNTDKYGGGGIYNFYGLSAARNDRSFPVFVHELGHSLVGLGDEYFSSEVAYQDFYNLKTEPWEPNLTTLVDFGAKWRHLLDASTPIPTPDTETHRLRTGVFEGGGYVAKGVYRPAFNCRMKSNEAEFCEVCREAIEKTVNFYAPAK